MTAILHRGLRNDFFFITFIYFFQFLFGLLFPFSLWTYFSLFSLDFYFLFFFGLLFSLFSLDFYFPFFFGLLVSRGHFLDIFQIFFNNSDLVAGKLLGNELVMPELWKKRHENFEKYFFEKLSQIENTASDFLRASN